MAAERRPDRIHIRDLRLRCIVGTNGEERVKQQEVVINITLEADLRAACASDRIEDTADYRALKLRVVEMVEKSRFFLIERLAEAVAALCLREPRAARATVTVDKPGALRFARSVAVEITRDKEAGA
ncbi:MAG: dihydroneopterin aldolase [Lentisphaerae bacterium]|nr:dihydroneopterin aldolase [Lentisphaerota bacterium]